MESLRSLSMALRYTNLGLLEYTTCSPLYDGEDSTKPINHAFSGLISVLIFPSVLQLFICFCFVTFYGEDSTKFLHASVL